MPTTPVPDPAASASPVFQNRKKWLAQQLGLAALSGAAGVFCFAPFEGFWLAPLVWLALFWLLRRAETPRQGMLTGFAFGLAFFLGGVSWIYVSLSIFGGMPWWLAGPATLLFCATAAAHPALAAWVFKRWQPQAFWRQAVFFAALLAATDWVRSWIFTGFPWLSIGYSQAPPSPLAGFAPLIGVFGLSLLVSLSGAALLRWRSGLALLALLLATGAALRQIAWTQPDGAPFSVALIQGNIPQDMKFQPEAFIRTLTLYRDLIAEHPAQLVLLPETALPTFLDRLPPDYLDELKALASSQGGDLIVGTISGEPGGNYYNSAISLGASPLQIYSKSHLVPFGESIPAGFAWLMAYANIPMSSFSAGPARQAPMALGGRNIAVNICYEDVFGDEIIRALPQAGLLANLSNTAWFGRSLAQPQHLQIAQMRSAETGRPMLRATNTGMTAIIDQRGELQAALPPFETGVLQGRISVYRGQTPFGQFGNQPFLALLAFSLLLTHWPLRRPA